MTDETVVGTKENRETTTWTEANSEILKGYPFEFLMVFYVDLIMVLQSVLMMLCLMVNDLVS